eukprot:c20156_g1_i1.p1 GENE.c20156_g1_i1~~c20156_g1_i1.p1  ORF type:complete len:183 (+),score=21.45 c20156_g1_i1:55-603(+)
MSGFSESTFVEKLGNLQNTQQSIQTISGWVLYHKKRFKQTVAVWEQEVNKAPTAKKLTLFYLANDIIQNAKRKKITEFLDEFSKTIRRTLPHIYRYFWLLLFVELLGRARTRRELRLTECWTCGRRGMSTRAHSSWSSGRVSLRLSVTKSLTSAACSTATMTELPSRKRHSRKRLRVWRRCK